MTDPVWCPECGDCPHTVTCSWYKPVTPTTRPALTEPATEAGRALLDRTAPAPPATAQELHRRAAEGRRAETRKAILAIEAEAVQREREALRDLWSALVSEHGHDGNAYAPWPSCLPVHIALNRARRLLGLEGEK